MAARGIGESGKTYIAGLSDEFKIFFAKAGAANFAGEPIILEAAEQPTKRITRCCTSNLPSMVSTTKDRASVVVRFY